MKNIFLAFIIVTLILSIVPLAAHADEITTPEEAAEEATTPAETAVATEPIAEPVDKPDEVPTETPTESPTDPTASPDDTPDVTWLDRIAEAWEKGEITTVISLALNFATIILIQILKKASKKSTLEVTGIFAENGAYTNGQKTTVKAVNNLIEAANDVVNAVEGEGGLKGIVENFQKGIEEEVANIKKLDKEKLESYGKQLGDTMAAVKLLSEMLQTVYANSTTIPMPVKNMIGQKYVEICDLMNHEEKADG